MNPRVQGLKSCFHDGYRLFACVLVRKTLSAELAAVVNGVLIDNGLSSPFYLRGMILRQYGRCSGRNVARGPFIFLCGQF